MARNCVQVICRRVPFVSVEAVSRISAVQIRHQLVADHFGNNRRGSDRGAAPVTVGDAALRHGQLWDVECVDEHHVRLRGKREHGTPHGTQRGLMDVDAVNLPRVSGSDAPGVGVPDDRLEERGPSAGRHQLRVAEARNVPVRVQDDGGRHDRPRQAPSPDLVDAGDVAES